MMWLVMRRQRMSARIASGISPLAPFSFALLLLLLLLLLLQPNCVLPLSFGPVSIVVRIRPQASPFAVLKTRGLPPTVTVVGTTRYPSNFHRPRRHTAIGP
jgi:hypothetical protein